MGFGSFIGSIALSALAVLIGTLGIAVVVD
jgi:hypothetical protein